MNVVALNIDLMEVPTIDFTTLLKEFFQASGHRAFQNTSPVLRAKYQVKDKAMARVGSAPILRRGTLSGTLNGAAAPWGDVRLLAFCHRLDGIVTRSCLAARLARSAFSEEFKGAPHGHPWVGSRFPTG